MVGQENMNTNKEEIFLEGNDIIKGNINNFEFNNTTDIINSINNIAKFTFDQVIDGKIILENLPKQEQQKLKDSMTTYIKSVFNKDYILAQYFDKQEMLPGWLSGIIEHTYYDDIGKIELNKFFDENDLISLGRSIVGDNWDGSNISIVSPEISNICPGSFFSEEQFVTEFNSRNIERTINNINDLNTLNIIPLFNISKIGGKLYANDEEFTEQSFEKPQFLNGIYQKLGPKKFANINELKKTLSSKIKSKWFNLLSENTKDSDESNESNESTELIDKIQSMKLKNIDELTDGEDIQSENVNHIFEMSKKYFIQRINTGENKITDPNIIRKQIAYILGTAKGECNFKNVKQKGSRNMYCGRGFVQLTYGYNYKKFGNISQESGITFKDNDGNIMSKEDLNLYKNPNNILKSNELAAFILIYGSINGSFTGKKLDDYINDEKTNFLGARGVIGGKHPKKYVNTSNTCLSHIEIG